MMKYVFEFLRFLYMKPRGVVALLKFRSILKNFGAGSRADFGVEVKYPENIYIGNNVSIGPLCTLGGHGSIQIEDNVRVSKGVTIETAGLDLSGSIPYSHISKPIHIKSGAWLGARCIVLGGVTIGKNAVIGAGAIISKDVADNEIVVSQSVRVVGKTSDK